jgi:hypothetical protein
MAVVGALVAILVPALSSVRSTGRMVVCVSNVRQQGLAIARYAAEFRERLPPKFLHLTALSPDGLMEDDRMLINRFLARWEGDRWAPAPEGWETPAGMWRCPEVRPEMDGDRYSHNGILHHAPNAWLFSSVVENRVAGTLFVSNQAHMGWDQRYAQSEWRRMDTIRRADSVITLIDNVAVWNSEHNHRDALEGVESGCEVVRTGNTCGMDKRGSHDRLSRRPAAFVDGHAGGVSSLEEYWFDEQAIYAPPGAPSGPMLWHRDVEHFVWYADPRRAEPSGERPGPSPGKKPPKPRPRLLRLPVTGL